MLKYLAFPLTASYLLLIHVLVEEADITIARSVHEPIGLTLTNSAANSVNDTSVQMVNVNVSADLLKDTTNETRQFIGIEENSIVSHLNVTLMMTLANYSHVPITSNNTHALQSTLGMKEEREMTLGKENSSGSNSGGKRNGIISSEYSNSTATDNIESSSYSSSYYSSPTTTELPIAISYSQSLLESNVNDKESPNVVHQWDNEPNETINSNISSSFRSVTNYSEMLMRENHQNVHHSLSRANSTDTRAEVEEVKDVMRRDKKNHDKIFTFTEGQRVTSNCTESPSSTEDTPHETSSKLPDNVAAPVSMANESYHSDSGKYDTLEEEWENNANISIRTPLSRDKHEKEFMEKEQTPKNENEKYKILHSKKDIPLTQSQSNGDSSTITHSTIIAIDAPTQDTALYSTISNPSIETSTVTTANGSFNALLTRNTSNTIILSETSPYSTQTHSTPSSTPSPTPSPTPLAISSTHAEVVESSKQTPSSPSSSIGIEDNFTNTEQINKEISTKNNIVTDGGLISSHNGNNTAGNEFTTTADIIPSTVSWILLPSPPTTTIPNGTHLKNMTADDSSQEIDDDIDSILSHRRCPKENLTDIEWSRTDSGVLALKQCPDPYTGSVYRPCYLSGSWGNPDYNECRLEHLKEIQSLIFYHVHKHLVDGLYPLAEDLARLVTGRFPIKSPMDKLDAIDALNAILRAKIKIRMEDEERNVNLIQSLMTISDHLITRTKIVFSIEKEKNALITMKTAEALFGFRLLSENILRALIVSCDDGTIRRIKQINPNSQNIIMTLTHRTPFGSLIPLVTPSNYTTVIKKNEMPQVIVHLEDFNKLGVGIASVWIKEIGSTLDSPNFQVISDIVLVSVVPAVSIEVDFEETPRVEVELIFKKHLNANDDVSCGRIKSPRDLWLKKGCDTLRHNLSSIHCICNELGIIAALIHKPSAGDSSKNMSGHHHSLLFHSVVIYISLSLSFLLLVIAVTCQIVQRNRESKEGSFILINLIASLSVIQLIFLIGAPFRANFALLKSQKVCFLVPIILHYVHLVSGFWMLAHSIFLYQRLWRPVLKPHMRSSSSLHLSETNLSFNSQSQHYSRFWCPSRRSCASIWCDQWYRRHFLAFATLVPAISVFTSYLLNSKGYETKRYCWMSIEGGMLYSFIVPVSLLIMTNTVIMLLVLKRFFENKPLTHKIEIDKTQPSLRAGVTLLPFFAVNWFLSVLALEDTATTAFQCIFAVSNFVQCYIVFLFHCYQRYEIHDFLKVRIFGINSNKSQKSAFRLKKSHPERSIRVDIPRLCIGDDLMSNGNTTAAATGTSNGDSLPLLMPSQSSHPMSSLLINSLMNPEIK